MSHAEAVEAARASGVNIEILTHMADHEQLGAVLAEVWQVPNASFVVDPDTTRALSFSGNYVVGAFADTQLVAGAVAFAAPDGHLHSHVAGVTEGMRGRGVGYAIKLHQRAWAIDRGIESIKWTFDPAQPRNARFNIQRLGGIPVAYLPNFYGEMADGINAGTGPSDRILIDWQIQSSRVSSAIAQRLPEPSGERIAIGPITQLRDSLMAAFENERAITGVSRDGCYVLQPQ